MPTPHAAPVNHALATGDQTLTEVDAKLTRLDKTCHRQPRTNLNNPEQIRTNPNIAERLDQIGPPLQSPPNTPKKNTPEHRRRPLPPASFLPAQE